MSDAYKKAGVDIDAGARLIETIGPIARSTARAGADAALGGFGAAFDLKAAGFNDPILISGSDGVGTKLKIAFETGCHETIGIDLVAMCANDVLAQGAEPLFFLDYFATGALDEGIAATVISGIAEGCRQAGCALTGGETAEMPGMYPPGEYDLAGFCVGAAERNRLLPRPVAPGDMMIGLASSGPHSNGYSLIRKIVDDGDHDYTAPAAFARETTLGEALLAPTRIYVKSLLPLFSNTQVKAFAHITGGGLTENIPRVIGEHMRARLDDSVLAMPPVFEWLQHEGALTQSEMRRAFNCGIGGVLIVAPETVDDCMAALTASGEDVRIIGAVVEA